MSYIYCSDLNLESVEHFNEVVYAFRFNQPEGLIAYIDIETGETFINGDGMRDDLLLEAEVPMRELKILNEFVK